MKIFKILIEGFIVEKLKELYEVMYSSDERNIKYTSWQASKVVPIDKMSVVITLVLAFIFLHEQFTTKSLIGCMLIGAGTLLMVL